MNTQPHEPHPTAVAIAETMLRYGEGCSRETMELHHPRSDLAKYEAQARDLAHAKAIRIN